MNLKSDKKKTNNRFIYQMFLLFVFSVYSFLTHSSKAGLIESSNDTFQDIPNQFPLKKNCNKGVITSQPASLDNISSNDLDDKFFNYLKKQKTLEQYTGSRKSSPWWESAALILGTSLKFLPISPFSYATTQVIGNIASSALCIKGSFYYIFAAEEPDKYDICTNICIPYSSAIITSAAVPYDAGILTLLCTSGVSCMITTTSSLIYYFKKRKQ